MKINFPIDFVVLWVDDSDENWQQQKNIYKRLENDDKSNSRFRDAGLFKYWFRSVEKYAPWVNHIYLVTNGQVPKFLNLDNKKITLIRHSDIMPEDALPTFNSNAIEFCINSIPNLNEHFVVFNDDMFLNKSVKPNDFFSSKGIPKDTAGLNQVMPIENFDHIIANNISIINNSFNKAEVLKKQWRLFFNLKNGPLNIYTMLLYFFPRFSRLYDLHIPYSFRKSLFDKFVDANRELVSETIHTKFRSITDISLWGIRYFQIVSGNISPRKYNFGKFYTYNEGGKIIKDIINQRHHIIDINDSEVNNYTQIISNIVDAFEKQLPTKSSFEN